MLSDLGHSLPFQVHETPRGTLGGTLSNASTPERDVRPCFDKPVLSPSSSRRTPALNMQIGLVHAALYRAAKNPNSSFFSDTEKSRYPAPLIRAMASRVFCGPTPGKR